MIKFKTIHQDGYIFENILNKTKDDIINAYKRLNNEIENTDSWDGILTPVIKVIFNDGSIVNL